MTITKIEAQIKQKGRYSIFIDDAFAFGLSELGLINSGLRLNQELSSRELATFKEEAKTDKIYNQTLGLIARRPRSEWEVRDYLKRKATDPEAADAIINRLNGRGYIDDQDFAQRWVESRRLRGPISKRKLEIELRTKRIHDSVIKAVLNHDESDEYDVLLLEIKKKRRQPRYQDDKRLMQYLARQGYSYDDIKRGLASDTR
ncbi:MAG: RecX family transcriptional regulator [Candidatus Saccharimonadales bacterium]